MCLDHLTVIRSVSAAKKFSFYGLFFAYLAIVWLGIGLLLGVSLPIRVVVSKARHRRDVSRLCKRCGYDLRGCPPDATACPECGQEMNK